MADPIMGWDWPDTPVREAVMQALGAVSACWSNLAGAGRFDADRANAIGAELVALLEAKLWIRTGSTAGAEAVPMRLHCPECHELHLDVGEYATKVHTSHACQSCGHVWRPAVVATVGVRFLPGFLNEPTSAAMECG